MALQDSLLPVDRSTENNLLHLSAGLRPADLQRLLHSLDQSVSANTRAMYSSA